MDKKVRNFNIETLIDEFKILWSRGARNFKFIDRTFNLNIKTANRLLDFFLTKNEQYFVHFEVIPDHFPVELKERIKKFPPGSLQLEIGIQTLNQDVANNISRNLNLEKIKENIEFLQKETNAHLHLDLIVGLPGENLEMFGKNLDELCALTDSEIQIGILKKLSGTALTRHDMEFGMIYSDIPPYDILKNNLITFKQIQKMKRFARFWDLAYNSGNFKRVIPSLWEESSVFNSFYKFSDWIFDQTESTWKISLERLSQLLFCYLTDELAKNKTMIADAMAEDIMNIGGRSVPHFLKEHISHVHKQKKKEILGLSKRQIKHM